MTEPLYIIKIGGQVIDQPDLLDDFLTGFANLTGSKILIHGGGKTAGQYLERLGLETKMVDGRRITDKDTLDVVTMVYAGLTNKTIVSKLQSREVNALGLSGADLNLIRASKRPVGEVDYGFAGDIEEINVNVLKMLIADDIVPVLCSITHNENGQLLNTNADTIASKVAKTMASEFPVILSFCFEQSGVLKAAGAQDIYPFLNRNEYEIALKNGTLTGGILPKLSNAFEALEEGVAEVVICHYSEVTNLGTSIFTGTAVKL